MTVPAADSLKTYLGNGVTTVFNGPRVFDAEHVGVTLTSSLGVVTIPDFEVEAVGDLASVITLTVAPPSGSTLEIRRSMPIEQTTDLTNQQTLHRSVLELAFDRVVMMIQDVAQKAEDLLGLPGVDTDPLLRADLGSAGGGSGLVTFKQAGGTAVVRTSEDKMRESISVKDFGALGNGVANDNVAIENALAHAVGRTLTKLYFPAGRYMLTKELAVAVTGVKSVQIVGDGPELTILEFNTTSGDGISFLSEPGNWWMDLSPHNTVQVSGMTIVTTKANLGTAIKFNMGSNEGRPTPPCSIRNVTIRGKNSFSQCFAFGISLLDTTSVRIENVVINQGGPPNTLGTGIDIQASTPTAAPTICIVSHCEITYGNFGIQCGSNVEGLYLTQTTIINTQVGVRWVAGAESGLHCVGGHFNNYQLNFDLQGVFDVAIGQAIMFGAGGAGTFRHIRALAGGSMNVTGCVFRSGNQPGDVGIEVDNYNAGFTNHATYIGGNIFSSNNTAILLGASSQMVHVGDNLYQTCTTNVNNLGTNNYVQRKRYSDSVILTLTGGAATETVNIAIPAGVFKAKPSTGTLVGADGDRYTSHYNFSAGSTPTNARFLVGALTGTLSAGPHRFSLDLSE